MSKKVKAKHTPGPWKGESGGRHITGKGRDIARVFGLINDSEADANARLILAAPELLAALARIANETPFQCDAHSCECGENGSGFDDAGRPCEHIQAHRALAKAKGV